MRFDWSSPSGAPVNTVFASGFRCLDAFRLVITPLVSRFDLARSRFVRMLPRKQAGDGSQNSRIAVPNATHEIHASPLCFAVSCVCSCRCSEGFRFFHETKCKLSSRIEADGGRNRQSEQKQVQMGSGNLDEVTPVIFQICKKTKSPNNGMIARLIRPSFSSSSKRKSPTSIIEPSSVSKIWANSGRIT